MCSFQTLIELFTNSLDGEENMNFPLHEELPWKALARRVARLKRICKIKNRF
jgi:hypothetical protein